MRILFGRAMLLATMIAAVPATAQRPAPPQRELTTLLRQDADLRERIARIQLDALVAQVDRTVGRGPHADAPPARPAALQRDLALYAF